LKGKQLFGLTVNKQKKYTFFLRIKTGLKNKQTNLKLPHSQFLQRNPKIISTFLPAITLSFSFY